MSDIHYSPEIKIAEVKTGDGGMEVAGYVSTFGNVDHGGDVVMRGAFDTSLESKAPVRFLYGHDSKSVIGVPLELRADDKGLFGRFKISQTSLGKDVHTLLKDGALDSFSIGYIPSDTEFKDDGTRLLNGVELLECSVVAMPMNAQATVTAVKADEKADWSTAFVNNLPDSAFAAIEPGGKKDDEGKTVPRSLRHYPHHGTGGAVDLPHLRNALARIADSSNYQGGKAHLERHAKAEGIGKSFVELDDDCPFEDLLGQVTEHIIIAAEAAEALQARREATGRKLAASHIDAIEGLLHETEDARLVFERILHPPAKDDAGMKLRLELARRLESKRALLETA